MSKPLKLLLIGCGGITGAHLPTIRQHSDKFQLIAASDPSEAARVQVAESLKARGEIKCFANHREALRAVAAEVDAALVVTPHFLHFPQAMDCLEAGLPVLIEKPICNNLEEVRQLQKRAEEKGLLVVAGQNRRYDTGAQALKQQISKNNTEYGELRSFDIHAWQNIEAWIATKPDKNADFWILDKERAGGGVVVSLLIHFLDMVRYLSGLDYVEARALGRFEPPFKNGAESHCSAILKMSNGATGTIHANYLARQVVREQEGFNLFFDHGYLGNAWGPRYGSTEGKEPDSWDFQYANVKPVESGKWSGGFEEQLLAFREGVIEGKLPMSHIAENFNTMAVIEAIYESMLKDGQPVIVATE